MNASTPMKEITSLRNFTGKTIKRINTALNQVEITFTDGSELRLEAEYAGPGLAIGKYVPKKE